MTSIQRRLPGNRYQRRAIQEGIPYTGCEIRGARSERGDTDSSLSAHSSIDIRHERGSLFMSCGDQSDRGIGERIHQSEGFFAGEGEQKPNFFILKASNQQLSHVHTVTRPGIPLTDTFPDIY